MGDRDKKPTVAFGQVLQELRAKKGLTQEKLAELAETERSHISALERAEKGPSLATILNLARALGMSAGEIVSMVEDRQPQKKR